MMGVVSLYSIRKRPIENGLDLFHEMLNNRLFLKSMIYMMADTLLLEAFPEMIDILTCSQVLDNAGG